MLDAFPIFLSFLGRLVFDWRLVWWVWSKCQVSQSGPGRYRVRLSGHQIFIPVSILNFLGFTNWTDWRAGVRRILCNLSQDWSDYVTRAVIGRNLQADPWLVETWLVISDRSGPVRRGTLAIQDSRAGRAGQMDSRDFCSAPLQNSTKHRKLTSLVVKLVQTSAQQSRKLSILKQPAWLSIIRKRGTIKDWIKTSNEFCAIVIASNLFLLRTWDLCRDSGGTRDLCQDSGGTGDLCRDSGGWWDRRQVSNAAVRLRDGWAERELEFYQKLLFCELPCDRGSHCCAALDLVTASFCPRFNLSKALNCDSKPVLTDRSDQTCGAQY